MCEECFSGNKIKTTTTFTVKKEQCDIRVKNVPCLKCRGCGEIIFTDAVSERLEMLVCDAAKQSQNMIVIDYER